MSGGVDVNIGADTRDFERSVKSGMQDPVEDAQKALDDYATAGGDAGQTLTDTFRTQQQQTTTLARDIDELNRSIRDGSSTTKRHQVADIDEFRHTATAGFDEAKDSARQNAIETAASFDGSFNSIAGGLQGLFSEFAVGFGPAGIIAGLVLASGIGVLTQQIDGTTEAAETQKQAVADLATQWIEYGKTGAASADDVRTAIEAMATSDGSDVVLTLQKAWELSKSAGADYQTVVESIASSNPQQLAKAQEAVEKLRKAHDDAASSARNDGSGTYSAAIKGAQGANQLADALDKAEKQAKDAARAQQLAARAGVSDLQLKQDLLGQLETAYDGVAGSSQDFIKAGKFDASGYVKNVDKMRDALIKYRDTLAKSDLSPAAKKFLEGQGADQAAAMLRGYQSASDTTKARLNEIWSTSGKENATNYGDALGKDLSSINVKPLKIPRSVVPAPDTSAVDRWLNSAQVKQIVLEGVTRNGKRVF